MDRFIECWDGLGDSCTGNAALHDFHEILAIAMCAVLCGGRGSVDMGLFAKVRIPTKPAMHSNMKPATNSDPKPAGIPT